MPQGTNTVNDDSNDFTTKLKTGDDQLTQDITLHTITDEIVKGYIVSMSDLNARIFILENHIL